MLRSLFDILHHPFNRERPLQTVIRLVIWKLNQIFTKLPVIMTLPGGVKCVCYPNSSYGGLVVYQGYPEYEAMMAWVAHITPKMAVVDVGANIGLLSLLAATKTQQPIFAFEADPRVFPRLQENIALNDRTSQITALHQAVSQRKGRLTFALESQTEVSHIQYPTITAAASSHTIAAVALDAFVASQGLKQKLAIKIDVEGAELLVLQGMKQLLAKKQVAFLLFEVNKNCHRFGYQAEELLALLSAAGYQTYSLEPWTVVPADYRFNFDQQTAFNLVAMPRKT